MQDILLQGIGWAGVVAYVTSYALLSFGFIRADSIRYQFLNAVGGICLVVFSLSLSDIPNVAVNGIWIIIAIVSLVRIIIARKAKKSRITMSVPGSYTPVS